MRYWDGNAWKGAPESPGDPRRRRVPPAGRAAGWCGSCWRWGSSRLRCWRGACSAGVSNQPPPRTPCPPNRRAALGTRRRRMRPRSGQGKPADRL